MGTPTLACNVYWCRFYGTQKALLCGTNRVRFFIRRLWCVSLPRLRAILTHHALQTEMDDDHVSGGTGWRKLTLCCVGHDQKRRQGEIESVNCERNHTEADKYSGAKINSQSSPKPRNEAKKTKFRLSKLFLLNFMAPIFYDDDVEYTVPTELWKRLRVCRRLTHTLDCKIYIVTSQRVT